ncbi:MAG: preprotein translocase subunit SecG [Nitrospira sp.]|nr:preprotein translocase subunit SecG [Nitrospira sp.]
MATLLLIIHLLVCFFLIAVVLLQSGKGAEMGAAFGGSSQTLFGSRGAATFLSKLTTVAAILFMITSFTLAIVTVKGGSVVKKAPSPVAPAPIQGGGVQPSQTPQTPQAPAQQQIPVKQQAPQPAPMK